MSKGNGLGDNFYIGGYDLSGDIGSVDQIGGGPAAGDVTSIKSYANERLGLLRDGNMQFTTFFNNSTGQEHPILSTLPTADTIGSYFRGTAIGNATACINGKQLDYDPTRDNNGNLTLKVQIQANRYGYEWGKQLTAGLRTDTTATDGSHLDNSASTAFGAQAYLQVIALTGTSVDVLVEHSADDSTYATLIDFGSIAAIGTARGAATGTVNRYVRVSTGSGTFSSITFAVSFMRNKTAVKF